MRPPVSWLLSLLLACVALAAAADDAERARIAAERQALNERFAQEERECQRRFAITPCLDDVRSRRRAALALLRARELQLDDAERQQRAADRRAAIEAKQRLQAARPPAPLAPAPEVRVRPPTAPAPAPAPEVHARPLPAPAPAASAATVPRRTAVDAQARAARAAERAKAAQHRSEAAAADRARIERRLAEREAAGKAVTPLPMPASAPGR